MAASGMGWDEGRYRLVTKTSAQFEIFDETGWNFALDQILPPRKENLILNAFFNGVTNYSKAISWSELKLTTEQVETFLVD